MEIKNVIEMYDNGMSCKKIGEVFGVSKSTVQRFITNNGYVYNPSTKTYVKQLEDFNSDGCVFNDEELSEVVAYCDSEGNNNFDHHMSSDEVSEKSSNEKMVNGSYTIPVSVAKALKLKAVLEDKKAVDIVREAIEKIIEPRYFNM